MPRWWFAICSVLTPSVTKAVSTEPALVPTTTSAVRGSQPVASSSARRAPTIHAAPRTPPAPSTSPRRTPEPPPDVGAGGTAAGATGRAVAFVVDPATALEAVAEVDLARRGRGFAVGLLS